MSAILWFLLLVAGKRVRKDVAWLQEELAAVIMTASPGSRGQNGLSPYWRGDATSQVGNAEQVTRIQFAGFSASRTARLVRMIFMAWLRRQSAAGGFNALTKSTITATITARFKVDVDTIEVWTRGPVATWSGIMLKLNPYVD